ncbi:MAG: UDP-N-acetylglucosamine 2-epimerase (non-hydrolyzing) [Thermomicrobiales bacterium]|nr:UDP-N-acetylglucosamine 2-epimerase (non-hydrolyzing) [Thermomicrobiales bacterium]
MKLLEIVGARPQFIKLAPVDRALRRVGETVVVHTGQHYDDDMSGRFFAQLDLPEPKHNLNIGSGPHGAQTGDMMGALEAVMLRERPDLVVVFGDTNSTLAGALAAVKLNIPVAHIEAGLRSFNRAMPEEINRVVTDHVSSLHFAPTENAVSWLQREGIVDHVYRVGDVMLDALRIYPEHAANGNGRADRVGEIGSFALVTIHRAANTDDPERFASIVQALNELSMPAVFPIHPRTRHRIAVSEATLGPHIRVIDPVDYLTMLDLMERADVVLTDSGGVQKEAYLVGTPCVTLRDETEWTETVASGWNVLVGVDPRAIVTAATTFRPTHERPPLFGDGRASDRIAEQIVRFLDPTPVEATR